MATAATRRTLREARAFAPAKPGAAADRAKAWLIAQPDTPTPDPIDFRVFTHAQLIVSPLNVRTDKRATENTAGLEASILRRGILQPLVVHAVEGAGMFGALAGGRRLRAVQRLIDRGDVPRDFPIPAVVRAAPDADLLEDSANENLFRVELRDYEIAVAVRRAHDAGHDVAALVEGYDQEAVWVRRQLVLAALHPTVFAAWASDTLSFDQAKAYAATEDTELQLSVFDRLSAGPDWAHSAKGVREALGIADAELAKLLRFVGDTAYRDAGGRFELDLFADACPEDQKWCRGRVVDPPLLRALSASKLAELKADLRELAGRELRFVADPPRGEYGTDLGLQIHPGADDPAELPVGDVVVTIDIAESGEAVRRFWWASRKAKDGKEPKPKPAAKPRLGSALTPQDGYGAASAANAAIRDAEGLSTTGIEICRGLRREALRAMLVDAARGLNGSVVGDYLVWAQARTLLTDDAAAAVGVSAPHRDWCTGSVAATAVRAHVDATPAHAHWDAARAELHRADWVKTKDTAASFTGFLAAPRLEKELAAAFVVGATLERSLDTDAYRIAVHDALALALNAGHASNVDRALTHWVPPNEAFAGLLGSDELRALGSSWVEQAVSARWSRLKRTELVRTLADLLSGVSHLHKSVRTKIAARQWVHPLLRFATANRPLSAVYGGASEPEDAGDAARKLEEAGA